MVSTLELIRYYRVSLKSNTARDRALYVATAASMGFITNITHNDRLDTRWHLTSTGARVLESLGAERDASFDF